MRMPRNLVMIGSKCRVLAVAAAYAYPRTAELWFAWELENIMLLWKFWLWNKLKYTGSLKSEKCRGVRPRTKVKEHGSGGLNWTSYHTMQHNSRKNTLLGVPESVLRNKTATEYFIIPSRRPIDRLIRYWTCYGKRLLSFSWKGATKTNSGISGINCRGLRLRITLCGR
jgi:hypothetical protein